MEAEITKDEHNLNIPQDLDCRRNSGRATRKRVEADRSFRRRKSVSDKREPRRRMMDSATAA